MPGSSPKPGVPPPSILSPKAQAAPKPKVFWTDIERAMIVKRAVDLQADRPGLAGLPLLRAALDILPANRRRDLIALSQAAWFTRMVGDEIKRREMEEKLREDAVSVLKEHQGKHQEWMGEHLTRFDTLLGHLDCVAHVAEEYRHRSAEIEGQRVEWEGKVLETLEQIRGELHDLNVRLAPAEAKGARPAGRARGGP